MVEQLPTRPIWEKQDGEKRDAVQKMFGSIAPQYDRANSIMSFNLDQHWRRFAVSQLNLKLGDSALDLCTGTGDFLPLLRSKIGPDAELIGIDFCAPMLEVATSKDSDATLMVGDACALPLRANSVDSVSVGWGIRNVPDIDLAHSEIFRVLKPGGRFVSIDCALPQSKIFNRCSRIFQRLMLGAVGTLVGSKTAYRYLGESTIRFRSRNQLADSMRSAGFSDIHYRDLMLGNICVHWGTKP